MSEAHSYMFRIAHGRRACWELARYLRVLPPLAVVDILNDVVHVLESGVTAFDLRGGIS